MLRSPCYLPRKTRDSEISSPFTTIPQLSPFPLPFPPSPSSAAARIHDTFGGATANGNNVAVLRSSASSRELYQLQHVSTPASRSPRDLLADPLPSVPLLSMVSTPLRQGTLASAPASVLTLTREWHNVPARIVSQSAYRRDTTGCSQRTQAVQGGRQITTTASYHPRCRCLFVAAFAPPPSLFNRLNALTCPLRTSPNVREAA